MFTRTMPDLKVTDLYDLVDPEVGDTVVFQHDKMSTSIDETTSQMTLRMEGPDANYEVPLTPDGRKMLSKWLDVPYKFYERVDNDLRQHITTAMLQRRPMDTVAVTFHSDEDASGIYAMREPSLTSLSPKRFVDLAREVVGDESDVVAFTCDPDEVMFEVVVPKNFDRGVGGDRAVDDITVGGLRFGQNRGRNLAPWVQPYLLRLACTNGMETYDDGLKVDARGATDGELLERLRDASVRAFASVESSIEAFYDLRNQPVDDATQAVVRLAREQGLPQRTVTSLVDLVPDIIADLGSATMFDVVNVVTNMANEPSIQGRLSQRRAIEQAGGESVSEHVARCNHCQSRMN